jgi:gliding motility-associated-like protein
LLNEVGSGLSFQPVLSGVNSYWLTALNGTCSSNAVEIILLSQQPVVAEISFSGSNVLCGNNSVQLVSSSQTNNQWSTNETSESIFVNQAGNYTLTVNGACNTDSSSIEVIDGLVLTNFTASVETGVEPLSVIFTDASEFADTCQWFVNGQLSSISPDVPQIYAMGTYSIMLICSNAVGCSDTLTRTIDVLSNKTELPNTFSPNGDGKNDFLLFTIKGIVKFDVVLFNRWGNKVAEWDSNSSGWDGMSDGKVSPEGVYFYILRARDLSDNLSEYKGSITLMR